MGKKRREKSSARVLSPLDLHEPMAQGPTSPGRPVGTARESDPRSTSKDYAALVDTLRGELAGSEPGDAYQSLMSRERRVLDTIDRVVNDRIDTDGQTSFLELPLHEIGIRAIAATRGLFQDLLEARRLDHVVKAVMKEDRKVYLGVILIMVALCAMFVDASS